MVIILQHMFKHQSEQIQCRLHGWRRVGLPNGINIALTLTSQSSVNHFLRAHGKMMVPSSFAPRDSETRELRSDGEVSHRYQRRLGLALGFVLLQFAFALNTAVLAYQTALVRAILSIKANHSAARLIREATEKAWEETHDRLEAEKLLLWKLLLY